MFQFISLAPPRGVFIVRLATVKRFHALDARALDWGEGSWEIPRADPPLKFSLTEIKFKRLKIIQINGNHFKSFSSFRNH